MSIQYIFKNISGSVGKDSAIWLASILPIEEGKHMKMCSFWPILRAKTLFWKNAQNRRAKLIFQNEPKFFYLISDFFNKFN